MSAYDNVQSLLDGPSEKAAELRAALGELQACIARGDMMLGLVPEDAEEVVLSGLKQLAELGDPSDQLQFVEEVYFGNHEALAEAAARLAAELANQDETGRASMIRGYMFYRGFGVERDLGASAAQHEAAAKLGNADSMFELFVFHTKGEGVEAAPAKAKLWLRKAADNGSARAQFNLGADSAQRGDLAKAAHYYGLAAEAGHGRAAGTLAVMLVNGDLPQDTKRAQSLIYDALELGYPVDELFMTLGLDPDELGVDLML